MTIRALQRLREAAIAAAVDYGRDSEQAMTAWRKYDRALQKGAR